MVTKRQREITELICYGHTDTKIATALTISEETVATHISRVLRSTDSADRAQLAYRAVLNGAVIYNKEGVFPERLVGHRFSMLLPYIARGWSNQKIANNNSLSLGQVEGRISTLLAEVGVSTRAELAAAYAASQKK